MRLSRADCCIVPSNIRCVQSIHPTEGHSESADLRLTRHDLRLRLDHVCVRLYLERRVHRPRLALSVRITAGFSSDQDID
jgi:hypothetical protein